MKAGLEQRGLAFAGGRAEEELDGDFLRANGENAGGEEEHDEARHHDADDEEAALQRVGQRLRAGVLHRRFGRRHRRVAGAVGVRMRVIVRPRPVAVAVVVRPVGVGMIVVAHDRRLLGASGANEGVGGAEQIEGRGVLVENQRGPLLRDGFHRGELLEEHG